MATLPIGIQTRSLRQPLRRALATAAQLGADGVEIDVRNELRIADFTQTALRQFRKLLDDLRLGVLAVSFPTRRGLDDPDDLERRVLATREAMTFAYKLGARVVIGRAGELPDDEEGDLNPTLVESLTLLAAHGERCGARYAFASGAAPLSQARLVERVGAGAVGVALHPGLLIGAGYEPAEAASVLGAHALHLHAADAVRQSSVAGGGSSEVQLGRGEADPPALLAALEERDYQGPVTIERLGGGNPLGEIEDAVAYLRSL